MAVGAALLATLAVVLSSGNSWPTDVLAAIQPEPITRAELLASYADIAPYDETATPDNIDALAETTCQGIEGGTSIDELITAANGIYRTDATEVVRLLVSYGCPQHLAGFK